MQSRILSRIARPALSLLLAFAALLNGAPLSYALETPRVAGEHVYYFLNDHLGSTDVVLDDTGQVVEKVTNDAYGSERASETAPNAPKTPQKFTGKELDEETGLYYYGARYYDSEVGRFISQDNWAGDVSGPQSLNKYAYALNNPVVYLDPTGNIPDPTDALALGCGPGAGLCFAAKEIIEWAIIGAMATSVVKDVTQDTKTVFPDSSPESINKTTLPAETKAKDNKIVDSLSAPASSTKTVTPAYEQKAAPAIFPVYENPVQSGCGINMSCASELDLSSIRNRVKGNSVEILTPTGSISYDLAGKAHYDKSKKQYVSTPHVQTKTKHVNPADPSQVNYSKNEGVRSMDKSDVRTVKKYLDKQGK